MKNEKLSKKRVGEIIDCAVAQDAIEYRRKAEKWKKEAFSVPFEWMMELEQRIERLETEMEKHLTKKEAMK